MSSNMLQSSGRTLSQTHKGEYFGALDGCRGVLALMVAIFHTPWLSKINTTPFLNQGMVILDLFFVFSGFLMFSLYQGRLKTGAEAKAFLWRRFARLYPVHLFMTLVFLAFAVLRIFAHEFGFSDLDPGEVLPFHAGASERGTTLLSNLLLLQSMGLHDSLSFNPPAWTISVEFYAYFIFAALMLWFAPRKGVHFVWMGAVITLIYIVLSRMKPDMDITYDLAFWRCLAGFYTGVLGAEIYRRIKAAGFYAGGVAKAKHHILELTAITAYVCFVIYMPGKLQFLVGPFALFFVVIFAFDKGFISKLLMSAPCLFLAKISYSVYMVHVIFALAADIFAKRYLSRFFGERWHDAGINGDLYLIPYLIVVIIAGYLLQRYVEAPCARGLGQWYKSRSKTASV